MIYFYHFFQFFFSYLLCSNYFNEPTSFRLNFSDLCALSCLQHIVQQMIKIISKMSCSCCKNPSIALFLFLCVRVCVSVCNCRAADEKGDAIPAVKKATHTHTDAPKRMQSRRRINRWALSQGAKQITSRYDICRQADRGGRSVPAGREQQLTAPSPGISFHSWRWEEEDGGGFRLGFPVFSLLQTYIF